MKTYRSRNKLSYSTYSLDTKNSFTSRTLKLEEEKVKKHKILTNLVESAGEARTFIHKNNILRQNISQFKQNNLNIRNIIDKIILYNKDIKLKQKRNNNDLSKDKIITLVKEFNEIINKSNFILSEKIKKIKEKNNNYESNIEKEIESLKKTYEDTLNLNFILENKNILKDSIIKIFSIMDICPEEIRYRYLNEEKTQNIIDKYLSKYLSVFQNKLLNATQSWNKYKNKAYKLEQEIEELQNFIKNPKLMNEKVNENENDNKYEFEDNNTENDIFLMTFDEFEEESIVQTLESENLETEKNCMHNSNNISNNNFIDCKKSNHYIRKINEKILEKRDIYYIPQKDYSKSLIRNSKSMKKKISRNMCPSLIKNERNMSINSISKLNLKQIVYNKNNKFIKEEAKELALNRYMIENELRKINIQNFNMNNPNNLKIHLEIKEIKKDIKAFKLKINRKKKIVKEFKQFYKELSKKYKKYIEESDFNENCDYIKSKKIKLYN